MPRSLEDLTQEELNALDKASGIMKTLYDDPETRGPLLKLIKKKNIPGVQTVELDTQETVDAALATERTEREKLEAKIRLQNIREGIRDKRAAVVKAGLVAESELDELEKFMTDNEIPNYDKAAKLFRQSKISEVPAHSHRDSTITMPGNKDLYKNPAAWARGEADKYFSERGQTVH
jgi:hypothetical protein